MNNKSQLLRYCLFSLLIILSSRTVSLGQNLTVKFKPSTPSIDDIVTFYGSAVVGAGTDFLSNVTSTSQLNAQVHPFNNFSVGLGANLLYANPGNSVKKDSVDFNSLMFPETGNFGVLASVFYKIPINKHPEKSGGRKHYLIPQFSFAFRRVSIDSPAIGFKVLNYNFGLKYQLEFENKDDNLVFSIMPYFHYFNIPDEDVSNFDQFVNDKLFHQNNANAEINSWGVKTTLQYNQVQFFFDISAT
jgi:hypothetical protein